MKDEKIPFSELLSNVVDNPGKDLSNGRHRNASHRYKLHSQ